MNWIKNGDHLREELLLLAYHERLLLPGSISQVSRTSAWEDRIPTFNSEETYEFSLPNPDLTPDVVIKIGSPEEFMPLVRTMTRLTGRRTPGIASGVGAMCGECTAIPLITGQPNISLGCGGSRPHAGLDPDQLLLALPIEAYRLLRGNHQ